ncbi:TonB-dependent receptor [Luteithermobacter gelatinilyticus]|uniref:TonB-dependent receptor n=1 Tax=Luteithermobacter gelatinilyticus TaxID=2582913 RepID=UPI001AEFDB2A|nr:TonB-dependent receptor [Luteithermobacter gelatinilyticus]
MKNKTLMTSAVVMAFSASLAQGSEVDAQDGKSFVLEEITVTARKRAENLQNTPISITAFTANDLENRQIDSVADLDEATPNLIFDTAAPSSGSNSAASVFIRGVGQVDFAPTTDPGVGIYVDGVYYARAIGAALDFLDLERISVLRGPQGTLFGRNTIGGALNIVSKKPAPEFGGDSSVTIGSANRIDVGTNINFPVSDNLLTKISASSRNQDGYVTNLALPNAPKLGDNDSGSVRASLLWLPSENIDVLLNADYTREREESAPNVLIAVDPTRAFPGFHNNVKVGDCAIPENNPECFSSRYIGSPFTTYSTQVSASEIDYWGVGITLDWRLGAVNLKSITAYRNLESYSTRDADHAPMVIFETEDTIDQDQFSQELQFSGLALNDKLKWVMGLYYFEEEANNNNFVDISVGTFRSGGLVKNDNKAVFVNATYDITYDLHVTAGLRYTKENKGFTPDQVLLTPVAAGPGITIPAGTRVLPFVEKKTSVDEWTPHLNISYDISENLMVYGTYSEGFKSGGFTQRVFPPIVPAPGQDPAEVIPSYDPEFVTSYEVGFKSSFWEKRGRLNVAAFYSDYSDMQILIREAVASVTVNAGEATMKGFEAELTLLPIEGLLVQGGIGYLDARYDSLSPNAVGVTINSKFSNAPEWMVSGSAAYTWELGGGAGILTPRIDGVYTSKVYNDAINTPEVVQDGFLLLNASLTYETDDENWRVVLGVRNLTDKVYLNSASANMRTGGYVEGSYARPREWSLTIKTYF